jgi:hypothetical protein
MSRLKAGFLSAAGWEGKSMFKKAGPEILSFRAGGEFIIINRGGSG